MTGTATETPTLEHPQADAPTGSSAKLSVAYLVSRYPAVSHTFVQREIAAIRRQGVRVETLSIRTPSDDELLTAQDREEHANTTYILPPKWGRLLAAHVRSFVNRPIRYLSTLGFALTCRPTGLRWFVWHLFYFIEAVFAWDHLRRRGISHVHVHFAGPCATVAMIASRLGDLGYSMTVHGPNLFFDVFRALLPEKVRRARFVYCISDFCRSQVMTHVSPDHWDKLHIVHCGIDGNVYRPADGASSTARDGAILCVGRLVPEKAQTLLVRAVARLQQEYPSLTCTFVGDGPDRGRLENLCEQLGIRDAVTFAGSVGQDRIQAHYDRASIFALPSFAEGLPVVLMEALAKGLPAVTTRIAGIGELVEDNHTGLIVSPSNVDDLVNAIRRLLTDPDLGRRLGSAGREKVLREFEITGIAARIVRILEDELTPNDTTPTGTQENPVGT